jgi:hypothetical protein
MLRHGPGLPASPRVRYILSTPDGEWFAVGRTPHSQLVIREQVCGPRARLLLRCPIGFRING